MQPLCGKGEPMGWPGVATFGVMVLASLPGGAIACPDGAEAARSGIVISYDDGSVSTYRRGGDGIVTEITLYDDPDVDGYVVVALHGLYVMEEYDLIRGVPDSATHERQSFELALKALPAPAPGLSWTGAARVAIGAEPARPREVSLSVGAAERVSYGGCGYDSWPVVLRHRDADEDYVLGLDYLPSMGIAVLRSFADFGGPADSYTPLSIAPATP